MYVSPLAVGYGHALPTSNMKLGLVADTRNGGGSGTETQILMAFSGRGPRNPSLSLAGTAPWGLHGEQGINFSKRPPMCAALSNHGKTTLQDSAR